MSHPPLTPPPASTGPAPAEDILYQGSVSLWMGWKAIFGAMFADLVGIGVLVYGFMQPPGLVNQIMVVVGASMLAASSIMLTWVILTLRSMRYKITTRLIEREMGLVIKKIDTLDLGRVKDVELKQSIMDRMLGIGSIEVFSSDTTDPVMRIEGLPKPRPIYERLRDAVISIAQRRGVIPMG